MIPHTSLRLFDAIESVEGHIQLTEANDPMRAHWLQCTTIKYWGLTRTYCCDVCPFGLTCVAGGRCPGCTMLVGIVVRYARLYIIGGIMGVLSLNVV